MLSIWTDDGELVAGPSTVSSGSGVFAAGTFDAVLSWPEERRGPAVLIAEVRGTNGTLAVTTVAIELAETTQPFAGPQPATVLGPVGDQRVDIEYQRGVRLTLHEPGPCDGELRPVVATGGPGGPVFAEAFAERGYVVANVSWRTPGYTEPSLSAESLRAVSFAVNDLAVAVQWLRFHAEELCLDEDRITAMGHSFGGITALSLAYSAGELESGELVSVDALGPAAEVGDPPPGSPPGLEHVDQRPNAVVSFSGFALADTIEAGEPPAMLVHGRNDSTVPFALAEQTCAAAAAVAVVCELVPHDAGHGIVEDRFDAVDAFLSADPG